MSFKGHKPNEAILRGMKEAMLKTGKSYDQMMDDLTELSPAFLRPAYQYTSLENDTVAKLHENDYLQNKRPFRARG